MCAQVRVHIHNLVILLDLFVGMLIEHQASSQMASCASAVRLSNLLTASRYVSLCTAANTTHADLVLLPFFMTRTGCLFMNTRVCVHMRSRRAPPCDTMSKIQATYSYLTTARSVHGYIPSTYLLPLNTLFATGCHVGLSLHLTPLNWYFRGCIDALRLV